MGQEMKLPDGFKGKHMADAFASAGLNTQEDNLSDGIGQSYGVVGYKGKVWSLRHRGQRHNVIRPDDGTPSAYLDVIILGQAKTKSKSFYNKKFDPSTSDGDRPICSSMDGINADADVADRQGMNGDGICALCPRNVWKTDPATGRKGRECTDYKRLAVLILPTQTKPILGEPLMEPVFLRVPPDSLNALGIMGDTMTAQGFHYASYITRITFDPDKAHPCMVFSPLQGLSNAEAPVILDLMRDPAVGRITGGDAALAGTRTVVSLPTSSAATGLTAPTGTVVEHSPAAAGNPTPPTPGTGLSALDVAPPATPSTPTSTSATATTHAGLVDTGFGGATNATPSAAAEVVQPSGTGSDAGEPEESDAAMDARIAALISK